MSSRANRHFALRGQPLVVGFLAGVMAAGCEDPPRMGPPPAPSNAPRAGNGNAADGGDEADAGPGRATLEVSQSDFAESDRTRDPFRSFAQEFVPVGPEPTLNEGDIKLREYALDELRLVAVVVGTDVPYAMVVDPSGRGTLIRRGDYVGRPETVTSGPEGNLPHQVPWRVTRIVASTVRRDRDNLIERPGEVVFEREDRLNPTAARAEHVLSLNPAEAANRPVSATQGPVTVPGVPGNLPYLPPLPSIPAAPSTTTSSSVTPSTGGGVTYTQSYTTIVPPQPAQPAPPTTVVIQTGPQGQTTIAQGSNSGAPSGGTYTNPGAGPSNGALSNQPPPVVIHSGPTQPAPPLPSSGLPH